MAKRRNLKKEKQERNRAYARKFKKRKMRNDGRGEGAGNVVTGCQQWWRCRLICLQTACSEGAEGPLFSCL